MAENIGTCSGSSGWLRTLWELGVAEDIGTCSGSSGWLRTLWELGVGMCSVMPNDRISGEI